MIVKCEQCQTRFKIPDDKVTDKGVKVRCTKCSHTFRVTRDMAQPATVATPVAGPPGGADPFARFGAPPDPLGSEVTRPGVFALGVEATRHPGRPPPQAASAVPFDFGSLTPPAAGLHSAPTVPSVPAFVPSSSAAASPFDFAAIARPPAAPPAPASVAPAAFDFSNFAAPTQAMPPLPPVRPEPAALPPAMPAFDFAQVAPAAGGSSPGAFDVGNYGGQPGSMDDLGMPPGNTFPDSGPASPPFPSASPGGADGFFGSTEESPAVTSQVDGAAARAMFDLPVPAPGALLDLPAPEPEEAQTHNIERVSLGKPAVPPAAQPAAQAPPLEEPARRRSVVGIVVNVAIAAVLVFGLVVVGSAYLNEGKFSSEALSIESLKNTFAPSVDFVANDVSNGLYETRAGRSVFFVRGEVMNRSEASVKVVVKAEIVEDGKVVRFGESWAGEPATPEEIFLIDSSEALEALNRKVEKRSLVVPPGAAAAFVVPFTEFPPDLKGFRVRVSARSVSVSPTAANP